MSDLIKTVGQLIEALQLFDPDSPVGVYDQLSEEGGAYAYNVQLQRADDESTHLYYKGDSPIGHFSSLDQLVTIVGSDITP